jgi:hypothetical protein
MILNLFSVKDGDLDFGISWTISDAVNSEEINEVSKKYAEEIKKIAIRYAIFLFL